MLPLNTMYDIAWPDLAKYLLFSLGLALLLATAFVILLRRQVRQAVAELAHGQQLLKRSEESLSITLHSIGDAVIATDAAGLITRMNPVAERLTGWTLAEALGRTLPEVFCIIDTGSRQPRQDPAQRVLASGQATGLANHTSLLARGGAEYQIADSAAPIRDSAGHLQGMVLVFSDVSEAYRVQASLAVSAELLERTGALAKVGGWQLELATMKLSWTRETFRIAELSDALEPPLADGIHLFAPEARPLIEAALQAAIDSGTPYDMELPWIGAQGTPKWVRTQGSAVRENGITLKLIGTIQDISESHQAKRELELSLQEKVGLLNEVHHRVKNNLQVITSLLRLEATRSEQLETRAVLGEMQARIRSMALLHESLYRSGIFASVDFASYLQQLATQAVRAQVGDVAVKLTLQLRPLTMSLDQAAPIGLLVNELISNSFKHAFPAGRGGELKIELKALDEAERQWCLRVSDNGVGLGDAAEFEARCARSLGMQLVFDLARQLGATLSIGPAPLAIFELLFVYDAPSSPHIPTRPAPLN
ncbi:PAS domain S-box protein [Paucibacter sp. TC2R-5]|uniref:sensor histidine kinase n=1 Tax=Paucibacter sp. TC2R-5 TaxID=2893555 RepID=UPI0021E471AE|nr:histidine kinase dimerization/phosphoacceptor domain -containing protein [Paucibacter sp. TC2R-5]MCV2360961.1 PAS domain S-box protein [Paucibacter sp. TC2R-5]